MKKTLILLYGVLCYLLFFVSFLYAIGFVGNFIVPKSIDSGIGEYSLGSLLINAILLGIFAIQHSIMARPWFKKWWTKIIGHAIERSTFVLITSLLLFLLYWKWQPMTSLIWDTGNGVLSLVLNILYWIGWLIVLLATFMVSHFDLFGLKQVYMNFQNKQYEFPEFKSNYFYTIVRHPIMLGFIIAFWATPSMSLGHLIFSIATTVYILIAVKYFEEKDLIKYHGAKYQEYQKKVPMIIPFTGGSK